MSYKIAFTQEPLRRNWGNLFLYIIKDVYELILPFASGLWIAAYGNPWFILLVIPPLFFRIEIKEVKK